MTTVLQPKEQERLRKLVGWQTYREEGLNAEDRQELRRLVGKRYPKEAERYRLERVVMLALGMIAGYAVLQSIRE